MFHSSLKVFLVFSIWAAALTTSHSSEVAENLTETADEAEFRQGGIGQQLMPNYPAMGGMYGGNAGYQYMANAAGGATTGSGGYVNMLRNLYRPSSLGLTDKVRHWVKSFMNRRQYVKPYYNPAIGGLSYAPSEFGSKPMFGNGYKAISIPLRQLQKYYKPYYGTSEGSSGAQYLPSAAGNTASASSFVNYNPSAGANSNGGLYASESASNGHFTGGSGGLYGSSSDGGFGASSGLFSSANSPFSSGSVSGGGLFNSPGGSSGIFSSSDGTSGLFNSPGGGLYGASGSPSSGLYHGTSGGSGNVFSVDGSSSFGSDGSSPFFSSSSSGGGYGSSAAASSILASLNSGSSGSNYGDLYASGANPAASLYNPSGSGENRGYGGAMNGKKSNYGASSSALYMSDDSRHNEPYGAKSSKELVNSFNIDTSRNSNQPEASYSVSFQPAQSKSYSVSSSYDKAGFQPVAGFQPESGNAPGFQEKSS